MNAAVFARPTPGAWHGLPESFRALLLLTLFTLATRGWIIGDPVVNIDEQFYLMVGGKLLHGVLPYVDIWDRKPVGLFLIYALACRLFANEVVGYQLLAAASVTLTAFVLYRIARRATGFWPALAGAAAYPAWLLVFGGIGGQSPVFYNLPMVLAAAWTLRLVVQPTTARFTLPGCAIMVLAGIAMQIKYTALFEGIYFGLTLLWLAWRARDPMPLVAAKGLVWIACALLPTIAALAAYAAIGHAAEFIQSNFQSVFGDHNPFLEAVGRLLALTFGIFPLLICVAIVWRCRRTMPAANPGAVPWLLGWAAAAYAGFLAYGVWNDHYVLPLLLPLSVLAGIAIGSVVRWRRLVALVLGLGTLGGVGRAVVDVQMNGTSRQIAQLTTQVSANLGNRCLYVNEQLSILYHLIPGCLPTRYVFPQHLALEAYQNALGIDQLAELHRVLAGHPGVIVISTDPDTDTRPESRQLLEATLQRDYRLAGTVTVGDTGYAVHALRQTRAMP